MSVHQLHVTEAEFMQQVIQYARLKGWYCYHTHDSRRSEPGFPDLVLVKPNREVLYAELKTLTGKLSEPQKWWIAALKSAGARVFIWRPTDESWESIREVLG